MNKYLIIYLIILWGFIVHSLISIVRTRREIKRLERASAILERMPPLAKSGRMKEQDALEIFNLLRDVPSNFALLLAEEKLQQIEGSAE